MTDDNTWRAQGNAGEGAARILLDLEVTRSLLQVPHRSPTPYTLHPTPYTMTLKEP